MRGFEYRDGRFFKDDKPFFMLAADYMHFRDRRDSWADRLEKMKQAGVNVVTSYLCWRHHLRIDNGRRWFDFKGETRDSRDLTHYLQLVRQSGLYLILKPGPFIHSETNVGGLPDIVSPTFNPAMPASRRHHGGVARWTYDASILPAALDEQFDSLASEWLDAIRPVIAPYAGDDGPLIALQMNDETLFCTSNDPPWHIGYEPSGMRFYHDLLRDRYGDVGRYNELHGTTYRSFDFVPGPKLASPQAAEAGSTAIPHRREDLLLYIDWAEYQWRLRRDIYLRYSDRLGFDLPLLTNYAGITPPIDENVPDLQEHAKEPIPKEYAPLYPEWWFAMNRVDQDADVFEYGMISWLGVAAYDRDVFDRYINTARRARGQNMEENWGFGTLYDARSRDPIVPFFQTLASIAGGATGYVIFLLVGSDYWDDELDRITKLQCNSFPSHAPVDENGEIRPMYYTAQMLNGWFAAHGQAFLQCKLDVDCAYLLYAPYAAVSSWIPGNSYWQVTGHDVPRCGREGFEEFSRSLQSAGYSFGMFELESATDEQMRAPRSLALQSAFFMGQPEQQRLADYVAAGGQLFISGELPEVDLEWNTCTLLKEAVEKAVTRPDTKVTYSRANMFASGQFADRLAAAGLEPNVRYSPDMRAYVYRGQNESFVFFFNFDQTGSHEKWVEFYGQKLELTVGPKTSGAVRIEGNRIAAWLVKGKNEVEGVTAQVRLKLGDQVIEETGDFSSETKN